MVMKKTRSLRCRWFAIPHCIFKVIPLRAEVSFDSVNISRGSL